jgi:D-glycero-alpha-D-manno-heptose 1-phosphate guanylyltransferase
MAGKAIVLAGGLGTRLRSVVDDRPKPMAEVAGKPFLEYILNKLNDFKFSEVRLSVGHKWEMIHHHFGDRYKDLNLEFVVEEEPLGTGGGLLLSFRGWEEALVLNGDTYFDCDFTALKAFYQTQNADMAIALKQMTNFDRYGTVEMKGHRITGFREKQPMKEGLINAGVYFLNRRLFGELEAGERFSFEEAVLEPGVAHWNICGKAFEGYFIDIGIPEDYQKANEYFRGN